MLGRLFSKLFGRKAAPSASSASRPVSPPPPAVPSAAPPPPPPPPVALTEVPDRPGAPATQAQADVDLDRDPRDVSHPLISGPEAASPLTPEQASPDAGPGEGVGGVRLILEDGTLAKPSLDPELEERLRYIVDNIVPPSTPPSDGPAT